jgi:hypothetical protein
MYTGCQVLKCHIRNFTYTALSTASLISLLSGQGTKYPIEMVYEPSYGEINDFSVYVPMNLVIMQLMTQTLIWTPDISAI